ncbi:hypothetical protein [Mycobacterium sp. SMC-4]|uniref:hypothetical protein n=1 Tax=Mycobacterium sp. SMC-4 TaxID=2857059 RepID=UPI0021B2F6D1|nr:hypothetical protein [Mycobacterium sp. SMC-4]UXA18998.1 hypothetical protein KXD98_04820 [Mycobacterium sp. SMC-4]
MTIDRQRDARRTLCAAEGVLVALQQCSLDDALLDIVGTARHHNVDPLRLATALLARAEGRPIPADDETLGVVVDTVWGDVLRGAPATSAAQR